MIRAILPILALSGCAVLSDHRVAAGCQVADGITTYIAVKKSALELNPLFSGMSPGFILILKLSWAYVIYKVFDPKERPQGDLDKFAAGAVTVVGCVPAINNLSVIRSLPK